MTKMRDSMPVVFAVLAGIFLLMIIFQWGGQGTLFEPKGEAGTLGVVNGTPITQKDYNKILESVTAQTKEKNKSSELSDADQAAVEDQAWDKAVEQAIMDQSIAKMGITVTDQEIRDVLFNNPPAEIKRQFTDSMGQFHGDQYIKALRDPRNDSIVRGLEAETRDQIRSMKWQQAMAGTVRVTDSEAFLRYMTDSAKAILQVIKIPAPQVTMQMKAQVPASEIQAYYDSHSWLYKQDELRKFKFVGFPLIPNARDTALAMETAVSLKARLAEAPLTNIDTVAKELALDYSDAPYEPAHVVTMRELEDDTSLFSTKAGDVAVAKIKGTISVVRVMQVFDTGRILFHVRHIPIGYPMGVTTPSQQQKDSVLAVTQQVLKQLQSGANFAELARTRSADPRSAAKGGDMGWLDTGMLPLTFRAPIATAAPGAMIGPLESPRGYDILQVEQRSQKAWAVVSVPLPVKPSHQTLEIESQSANIFRDQAAKNGFDKAASAAGYRVVSDAPPAVRKGAPIFNSHEFVDWCFESSKGDISQPFKLQSAHAILVAQLTDIIPPGPKPLEEVKSQIAEVLALRKAVASLEPRAQQVRAIVGPAGDLSAAAASDPSLAPITVLMGPAESVNGLPTGEYVVNNWAYSAQPGTVSPPLKGEHGYYIAKLVGRNIPTEKDFEATKPKIVQAVLQEKEQRLLMGWLDIQKQNAVIVDYRFKH
jgi:peptidyl-prolyl cis-trans isomerase D